MTIKEFAEHLGLSTATVSRAFTAGSRIHADTRAHILAQAKALGYAPNPSARNLARRRNRLIGLDFPANPDVLADLYLIELARGVQTAVQRTDYGLLLNTLPRPDGDLELLREWVFGRAVEGVVIVVPPTFPVEKLCSLANRDVPCVLITTGAVGEDLGMPSITLDLKDGARAALTHLRRLGHERIGFLTSTPRDCVYEVYQEIVPTPLTVETESTITEGRAGMHRLLAAPTRPTAVFCRTDTLALGALQAAREMGLHVPEDLSLIGHDDLLLTQLSDPALTTVRIDTARIGQLAIEALLTALALRDGSASPPPAASTAPTTIVGTELIVRHSTARNRSAVHPRIPA